MSINWAIRGYPELHLRRWKSAQMRALMAFRLTGVAYTAAQIGTIFNFVPPVVTAVIAAIFVMFAIVGSVGLLYDTYRYVRVIPYFETEVGDIDTFLGGRALASRLRQLDDVATEQGVRTISSYGFNDDLFGEPLNWSDPEDGLETIAAIKDRLESEDVPPGTKDKIDRDLQKWRYALERARAKQIRFCVLLRHENTTSGHEWDVRKGSAF